MFTLVPACGVEIHLVEQDIFIHPPPPRSLTAGDDRTLRGLVEVKCPTERHIEAIRVEFKGIQTLAIPCAEAAPSANGLRWEEKVMVDKRVEITSDGLPSTRPNYSTRKSYTGKAKGKEREKEDKEKKEKERYRGNEGELGDIPPPPFDETEEGSTTPEGTATPPYIEEGMHMEKGIHGFEFSFVIPATSAPTERIKHGRMRYIVTATVVGGGRGKNSNVSLTKEVYVILNAAPDGGPTPLDIQFHDVHDALGIISVALTSASLTVGGTASLRLSHPSPPPGLSVHVVRVFVEQTTELYSAVEKAWMKLPAEKLRIWERGVMPYKRGLEKLGAKAPTHVTSTAEELENALWVGTTGGRPGRVGIGASANAPTLAPFGEAMTGTSSPSVSMPPTPLEFNNALSLNDQTGGILASALHGDPTASPSDSEGYKLRAVMRLPDDNTIRPSTVKGSKAEIRITHEMGIEVFFSRENILDTREDSESFGKPKVQVFSMRRSTIIPSCACTYDTIHLPPYSFDSPSSSRPSSPTAPVASTFFSQQAYAAAPRGRSSAASSTAHLNAELDHWRLATTLRNALPHAMGGSGSRGSSTPNSRPTSRGGSRDPSPTRATSGGASPADIPSTQKHTRVRPSRSGYGWGGGLHGFTPTHAGTPIDGRRSEPTSASVSGHASPVGSFGGRSPSSTNIPLPVVKPVALTPPGSTGLSTSHPLSLPRDSPWAMTSHHSRTAPAHARCNCARSTSELLEAEARLLDGAPTAPGAFIDTPPTNTAPPPWTPASRPGSPELISGWQQTHAGREGARARGKLAEYNTPYGSP